MKPRPGAEVACSSQFEPVKGFQAKAQQIQLALGSGDLGIQCHIRGWVFLSGTNLVGSLFLSRRILLWK
jgi:hypothetical protein